MENFLGYANKSFLLTKDELKADLCELGLEAVFDNSQLPIATFFKNILKYGYGIHERKLVRNTLYFLIGFQSGNIDEDRLNEYKQKLQNDYSYFEEETTRIVMILENIVEAMRAKIIGCLYMNMINGRITHVEFCEYSDLTNRLYISELDYLSKKSDKIPQHTFNRMIGLGIMRSGMQFGSENMDSYIAVSDNKKWTRFGKRYVEIISGLV